MVGLEVGEPVEVTLTAAFELPGQGQISQRTVSGIKLGACFGTGVARDSNSLNNAQGYCDPNQGDGSPPAWLVLSGNTSHVSAVPDVLVRRGQRIVIEHTFSFARTEPGEVVILPSLYRVAEGDGPSWTGGIYDTITFK